MNNLPLSGSYSKDDVIFLLKNINGLIDEKDNSYRENAIQSGVHYSQMLPIEYEPSDDYMDIFYDTLSRYKYKLAMLTGILSEKIIKLRGKNLVIVSLARAGTPIGILLKRYIKFKYNINVPHYSISIIRDKGIDENALNYIINNHIGCEIQFIDGWTGKGVIMDTLIAACEKHNQEYGTSLNPLLGVLSDPAHCTTLYGTREDFLIPSACLNSTVSGLMSRTVLNTDIIGDNDFHGAKFYEELAPSDVSNFFINEITNEFESLDDISDPVIDDEKINKPYKGVSDLYKIMNMFDITDINLVKPGVGETTRVLLRRIPWCIFVDSITNPDLKHILQLANERNVPVHEYADMSYSCCGIIKPMEAHDL